MKPNNFYQNISRAVLLTTATVISHPIIAQIPQNIEVKGEPTQFWDYAVYVLILAGIILAIFLIARVLKKPRK